MLRSRTIPAALLVCGLFAPPLAGQDPAAISTLEVAETATVSAPANLVRLSFAVESNASEAGEAVRQNAQATESLLEALKGVIGGRDTLETSGYSLNPVYGRGNTQVTTGYRVRNTVILTSRDVDRAGAFMRGTWLSSVAVWSWRS